jgi:hypothetical protein
MIITNRLDKSYGPAGAFAGYVLFIAGLIIACFSMPGITLILIGAFVGFTSTSALIDEEKKRVRLSNNIFGIIKTGKWIDVKPGMTIGIKKSEVSWRAFSMGNRPLDVDRSDYRLVLFDSGNKEIMPLQKCDSSDSAKSELKSLAFRLGLSGPSD